MRLLGVAREGINIFCGLMDMSQGLAKSTYDQIVKHLYTASKTMFESVCKKAVDEEKELNIQNERPADRLKVSGDGSWKKRGYTSLYGVTTLIGYFSGKVVDLDVKSGYCHTCAIKKNTLDDDEFENWYESHKENCSSNHAGSAGKMEVDSIVEMFSRSIEKFGVMYSNYIGDGDTKTFLGILNNKLPRHGKCPEGVESWCEWRKAEATNTLAAFKHPPRVIDEHVEKHIRPIYEDLSKDDLLTRCLGGHTQNANESFNSTVWRIVPKHLNSGIKIVEIAAYIAGGMFNEGYSAQCNNFAKGADNERVNRQNRRDSLESKEARTARRLEHLGENQFFEVSRAILWTRNR
ncbi:hypothetical protein KGM_202497 [Danaus plexippus plexippus]|uniref:Mutator-like transposase domain-containing protein n=1 Tax=Danaus plexippus plexippus TaxID=278856 RepID=A0A212FAV0_DANPL|nr:hypothetical protein KGM_202497 [Danaus plexippus plexippus]